MGYKKYDIMEMLNKIEIEDTKILKKELDKAYKRFNKKYEGDSLNIKVRDYLYRKGFDLTSIKEEMSDYE